MVVVDSSVFLKLILDEPDSSEAADFFRHAIRNRIELTAPSLLLYETLGVALHHSIPFGEMLELLDIQRAAGFRLIEPSRSVFLLAGKIAASGSRAAGYPALQDSIYHAMAIEEGGVFLTADKRHVLRASQFGNIALLSEYRI